MDDGQWCSCLVQRECLANEATGWWVLLCKKKNWFFEGSLASLFLVFCNGVQGWSQLVEKERGVLVYQTCMDGVLVFETCMDDILVGFEFGE